MTVTWSMLAGHYMTRWADRQHLHRVQTPISPTFLVVLVKAFTELCLRSDSSKGKWGWSVWPPCKACSIPESLVHVWNFSRVVSRWASSLTASQNSCLGFTCHLYNVYIPAFMHYMTIICRGIAWKFPLLLHYRTVLCLWPWIRSTMLQCRPLDYWHLCYSQYSPSSTLQPYLICKASYLNLSASHLNSPFRKYIFNMMERFILFSLPCLNWTS